MDIFDKLTILTDSAKYDVACTSSGVERNAKRGSIGSTVASGVCHSFAADGRCICLLKILMTNYCVYDCKYCINRSSNDVPRAAFTPQELADLTIGFYRRNYIEGLFLSSGVVKNPDHTTELMIKALEILRNQYRFRGYIHVKAIPGADNGLITRLGLLADRMSVNIELPSQDGLAKLAPDKTKESILRPMGFIRNRIRENPTDLVKFEAEPVFVPAGQSTQLIIGATPDTDYKIMSLAENLYKKFSLRRVFFSAYMPVVSHSLLPTPDIKPPLMREHRLYQSDWLLRFYGFKASEILDEQNPNLNPYIDPKCNWALNHIGHFPVEVNKASYEMLLRVPGIGMTSAKKILNARKSTKLEFDGLKKLGVVLKRAQYFVTCGGKLTEGISIAQDKVLRALLSEKCMNTFPQLSHQQLSLFDEPAITREDVVQCLTGQI